jgi:AcrR family transcriptional regulator
MLFATRGYENTSTSAIAREAGTSESQLMKYFGGKQGLLEAIFTEGWKRITGEARAAMQNHTSPIEKLKAIATAALLTLERDSELKLLYLLEGRRVRREGQTVTLTEGYLDFIRLLDGIFYELYEHDMLRPGLHPQAVRSALCGMIEALLRDSFLAARLGFPAEYDVAQMPLLLHLVLTALVIPTSPAVA